MIHAYVNRGVWFAECVCKYALALEPCGDSDIPGIAWPQDTTKLMCVCGRVDIVQFPSNKLEIETTLSARQVVNRNWYQHETIADLRIENALHHKELTT